jgi:hypothetical protein
MISGCWISGNDIPRHIQPRLWTPRTNADVATHSRNCLSTRAQSEVSLSAVALGTVKTEGVFSVDVGEKSIVSDLKIPSSSSKYVGEV